MASTATTTSDRYARTVGAFYDADRTVKDDAASIRAMIKSFVKLGVLPADWKYSVRKNSCTHSWAIDVRATSPRPTYAADPRAFDQWVTNHETGEPVIAWFDKYTREARAVKLLLEAIHGGHNHDGSDIMTDYFDVKFYGSVSIDVADGVPTYDPPTAAA